MPLVERIQHTALTVSDLDRSVTFYRDRLGFAEVIRRKIRGGYLGKLMGQPQLRADLAILRAGDTRLELIRYHDPARMPLHAAGGNPGTVHLSLLVADVRSTYDALHESGVIFQSPPVAIDDGPNRGGWAVFLLDPDGYWVELLEFTPERRHALGLTAYADTTVATPEEVRMVFHGPDAPPGPPDGPQLQRRGRRW